jgi:hypothetical protein
MVEVRFRPVHSVRLRSNTITITPLTNNRVNPPPPLSVPSDSSYEMQFSPNFTCITGGQVKSVPMGSDTEFDMSVFGTELIYINAGLVQQCNDSGDYSLIQRALSWIFHHGNPQNLGNFVVLFGDVLGHVETPEDRTTSLRYPRSFRFS